MSAPAPERVAVLLLAASRGRAGAEPDSAHLLAAPMAGGTVLSTTLRHVRESGLPLTVVAGAEWRVPLLGADVALNQLVTLSAEPDSLGRAIAAGVTNRPNAVGWLVLPADMPAVAPQTLRTLAAALDDAVMVYPEHRGQRGQPMGFAGELCSDLLRLTDDDSVRRLLARYPTRAVPVPDPGVLLRVRGSGDLATAALHMQTLETN